ncbi:MobF family relaxase [Actinomadura kijaniata]|uniref:MobF family relaxase n=1 Tax=Actinomadura kijaniata TaxID=46161 RepID=UPI000833AF96|nr:MobF family relaxase [Actinomadura kijaniata]
MLTISPGYDPRYLTRQVAPGAENYYLSAIREHGEPPGVWWGLGAAELGLEPGSQVDGRVMESLYSAFLDPRDPDFLNGAVSDEDKTRLGRKPPKYERMADQLFAQRLAAEPDADPERQAQIKREISGEVRQAVMHHDATFSPVKSVTALHAGLQAAAVKAREAGNETQAVQYEALADKVWQAVDAGGTASLAYLQRYAGVARRGSHSQVIDGRSTGRFVDAPDGFVVARFRQHSNREGDPHLHIHQAILNRQLASDGRWSGLSGKALYRARAGAAAVGERVMYEQLVADLGVKLIPRADGNGWEIEGITPEQIAAFSTRATQVTDALKAQVEAYTAAYGRPPSARLMFKMHQEAHRRTKGSKTKLKDMPSRIQELKAWEERLTQLELGALSKIPGQTLGRFTAREAEQAARDLANLDYQRVLTAAVADAQRSKSEFSRHEVTRYISRHLPPYLGGLPAERVEALLEELTDAALDPRGPAGVRLLNAPDVVPIPSALRRADGTSVYQAPHWERYTTAAQLDDELELVASATATDAPGLHPVEALAALRPRCSAEVWARLCERAGVDPVQLAARLEEAAALDGGAAALDARADAHGGRADAHGSVTGALGHEAGTPASRPGPLDGQAVANADRSMAERERSAPKRLLLEDQALAVYGMATSRRRTDVMVGYAGTGKTFTAAAFADVWREQTTAPVWGLTTAQNAAYVLAGEGVDQAWNIRRFRARVERGLIEIPRGAVALIDEAGMVPTEDLLWLQRRFAAAGGKLIHSGDPAQLTAPGAGGMTRHLAETAGAYTLTTVLRFSQEWEREASVRLRAGVVDVLGEYEAHGRLADGTRQEMADQARHAYLADYLDGRQSLLLAPTNEQAAELAAAVRADLKRLGYVHGPEVGLYDANGVQVNAAAVGDLVVARENNQRIRVGDSERTLSNRDVLLVEEVTNGQLVARLLDNDGRSTSHVVELPSEYVREHVQLAYAATVASSQGRTVWRSYSLVDDSATRNLFYVMMTRGADGNWAFVVCDEDRVSDLRPGPEQAAERAQELTQRAGSLDGEAGTLDRQAGLASPSSERAPVRDRFSVLAGVLGREESAETALEAMQAEQQRPTHAAHLGAMWTGTGRDYLADRYINEAQTRGTLSPDQAARLRADEAKESLGRLLRQIEMSGRDAARILDLAAQERELGSADSIAQVLHWRITEAAAERGLDVKTLEPAEEVISATWSGRTRNVGDPEIDEMRRAIAAELDVREHTLGQQALEDPPEWLVRTMGAPPADDVLARGEWASRAGRVLVYREMYGVADETETLGVEPSRLHPEQRAAWYAAQDALHGVRPGQQVRASLGELWSTRARYERQVATAPPYVAEELKAVETRHRHYQQQAVLLRAEAAASADPRQRAVLENRARGQEVLAASLHTQLATLREIHDARRDWHRATEVDRIAAMRADAELRRRQDVDEALLPRLHTPDQAGPDVEVNPVVADETPQQIPGQLSIDGWGDQPIAQIQQAAVERAAQVQQETRERIAHIQETTAERVARVQQAAVERAAQVQQETRERIAHIQGQVALDLFGLGEGAPTDPRLAQALEQARAARQVVQARQDAVRQKEAAEAERAHRQPAPEAVQRQRQRTAEARRAVETRQVASPSPREQAPSVEAAEAARVARQAFPQRPRPSQRPTPPSPPPPRRDGPSMGGPSLG